MKTGAQKTRVLVVEDSSVMRNIIRKLLGTDPSLEIVGEAQDPYEARQLLIKLTPDVMILDIELPKMNGIVFLRKVMQFFPVRTLVYSSLAKHNLRVVFEAVSAGAIDVMIKPEKIDSDTVEQHATQLCSRVRTVAAANLEARSKVSFSRNQGPRSRGTVDAAKKVIAIASSTGGTEALKVVLPQLSLSQCAVLVVQHLPNAFVKPYIALLQEICPFEVREAVHGETVYNGVAYVAPGDHHLEVRRVRDKLLVYLHREPPILAIRPAADYLMKSVAKYVGAAGVGIVLTGMGKDGSQGLLEMHKAGAYNIAQDEETSVVYGMPKEAVKIGAIDKILPLSEIPAEANAVIGRKLAA